MSQESPEGTRCDRARLARQIKIGELLHQRKGGILIAPTGAGKTVTGLAGLVKTIRGFDARTVNNLGAVILYCVNGGVLSLHTSNVINNLSILGVRSATVGIEINTNIDKTFLVECTDSSKSSVLNGTNTRDIKLVVTMAKNAEALHNAILATKHHFTVIVLKYNTLHRAVSGHSDEEHSVMSALKRTPNAGIIMDEADTLIGMKLHITSLCAALTAVGTHYVLMCTATPPDTKEKRIALGTILKVGPDDDRDYEDMVVYMSKDAELMEDMDGYRRVVEPKPKKVKRPADELAGVDSGCLSGTEDVVPPSPSKKARMSSVPTVELVMLDHDTTCPIAVLPQVATACLDLMLAPINLSCHPEYIIRRGAVSLLESIALKSSTGLVSMSCISDIAAYVMDRVSFTLSTAFSITRRIFPSDEKLSTFSGKKLVDLVLASDLTSEEDCDIRFSQLALNDQVSVQRALLSSIIMRSTVIRICNLRPVLSSNKSHTKVDEDSHKEQLAHVIADCWLWRHLMESLRNTNERHKFGMSVYDAEMVRMEIALDQLRGTPAWKSVCGALTLFEAFFKEADIYPAISIKGTASGCAEFCTWIAESAKGTRYVKKSEKVNIPSGYMSLEAANPWLNIVESRIAEAAAQGRRKRWLVIPHRSADTKAVASILREALPASNVMSYDSTDRTREAANPTMYIDAIEKEADIFVMASDCIRGHNMEDFDALILPHDLNAKAVIQAAGRVTRGTSDRSASVVFVGFRQLLPTDRFVDALKSLAKHIKARSNSELDVTSSKYEVVVYKRLGEKIRKATPLEKDQEKADSHLLY